MAELGYAEGPIRGSARAQVAVLVMYLDFDVLQFAIRHDRSEYPFRKVEWITLQMLKPQYDCIEGTRNGWPF